MIVLFHLILPPSRPTPPKFETLPHPSSENRSHEIAASDGSEASRTALRQRVSGLQCVFAVMERGNSTTEDA
ncbi:hypothetical protein CEXT_782361 [Caerostris extrusa]|uniref:Uncharacterized protein n=1 Tax=Caerostris extrusa TaxID=172846 RepID=A0AAV4MHF1_CAEEX|nr:hypothetical protein CEXT_782361 [Caerostris extrusa]